eukprot:8580529-Pyramimonas_sp.AAC.1
MYDATVASAYRCVSFATCARICWRQLPAYRDSTGRASWLPVRFFVSPDGPPLSVGECATCLPSANAG